MKFNISRTHDYEGDVISFSGEVRFKDLISIHFDAFDRKLMDDVNSDGNAKASDSLLVLEMIFRRFEEQKK